MKTALKCLKAKLDYGTKYFSFCHNFTGMTWQVGLSYCLFSHFSRVKRVIWFNIGAKHLHRPKNRDKQETCSRKVSVKMFTEFSVKEKTRAINQHVIGAQWDQSPTASMHIALSAVQAPYTPIRKLKTFQDGPGQMHISTAPDLEFLLNCMCQLCSDIHRLWPWFPPSSKPHPCRERQVHVCASFFSVQYFLCNMLLSPSSKAAMAPWSSWVCFSRWAGYVWS